MPVSILITLHTPKIKKKLVPFLFFILFGKRSLCILIFLYLSIGDMHSHVVVEVLNLVELGGAHRAHVGGPFLAAGFHCHAHSCSDSGPDSGGGAARRHGQGHHAGSRLGHGHRHGNGDRADAAGRRCRQPRGNGTAGAVQRHVPLQQGLVGELLLADVALIGLLAAVQAHVDVEGALLGESLVTDAALVGTHARVRHHVLDEVILQGEGSPADTALVRFLTWRYVHTHKAQALEEERDTDKKQESRFNTICWKKEKITLC